MNIQTELFGEKLQNPLIPASGCFNFGEEAAEYQDLNDWGAMLTTAITLEPRLGNPSPRVCETASGMLNSVGLQNPGLDYFLENQRKFLEGLQIPYIVNVAGREPSDYVELCRRLNATRVWAIELNLSCPNVKAGGISLSTRAEDTYQLLKQCKEVTDKPLIAKLTPNVTNICEPAKAAEEGGASAISLINTLLAMKVDLQSRRPVLRNNTGGLSGPAIKPIALRMVADVYRTVEIPIIGIGGIQSGKDVLEFILCGATAVEIGCANFRDPLLPQRISKEMQKEMEEYKINSVQSLIGSLKYWNS